MSLALRSKSNRRSAVKSASKCTRCETSTHSNNIDIRTVNIKYVIFFFFRMPPRTQSVGFLVALQVQGEEGRCRKKEERHFTGGVKKTNKKNLVDLSSEESRRFTVKTST